jgi:hypothetical protein
LRGRRVKAFFRRDGGFQDEAAFSTECNRIAGADEAGYTGRVCDGRQTDLAQND